MASIYHNERGIFSFVFSNSEGSRMYHLCVIFVFFSFSFYHVSVRLVDDGVYFCIMIFYILGTCTSIFFIIWNDTHGVALLLGRDFYDTTLFMMCIEIGIKKRGEAGLAGTGSFFFIVMEKVMYFFCAGLGFLCLLSSFTLSQQSCNQYFPPLFHL